MGLCNLITARITVQVQSDACVPEGCRVEDLVGDKDLYFLPLLSIYNFPFSKLHSCE
jgi:hypothetical protein